LDTVHTEEFGRIEQLAFRPKELTEKLKEIVDDLPEGARGDVLSDEYLFGRGTMDMKMGLVLHFHILELASNENWPINLMLGSVADEEVESAGMRSAVKDMTQLGEQHGLDCNLFVNIGPSFSQRRQEENYHI